MTNFSVTKRVDGFSTCFRQWKASDTHCKYLHGYGVYFDLTFCGGLDHRNWVIDFGFMKRLPVDMTYAPNSLKPSEKRSFNSFDEWFKFMFDHTVVIAENDPCYESFMQLCQQHVIQLRVVPNVGCEQFAKYIADLINEHLPKFENGVRLVSVRVYEHEKNSVTYFC